MLVRQLYLTILYFRPTLGLVIVAGFISVRLNVTPAAAFALTVFLTFLQPFIEKMREIGNQLEQEAKLRPRQPISAPVPKNQRRSPTPSLAMNWRLLLAYLFRPVAVISVVFVVLFMAMWAWIAVKF